MTATEKQIMLNENELKTIIEVLKFAEGACPIQDITHEFDIDADKLEGLISKLEKAQD